MGNGPQAALLQRWQRRVAARSTQSTKFKGDPDNIVSTSNQAAVISPPEAKSGYPTTNTTHREQWRVPEHKALGAVRRAILGNHCRTNHCTILRASSISGDGSGYGQQAS